MLRIQYTVLVALLACCTNANMPVDGNLVIADSTISIIPDNASSFIVIYNSKSADKKAVLERYIAIFNKEREAVAFEDPEKIAGFWRYTAGTYLFSPVQGNAGLAVYFGDLFIQSDLVARSEGNFKLRHINEGAEEVVIRGGDAARVAERFNSGERLELEEMFVLHDRI